MTKRTIFIGDVHGCLYELKNLLDKVKYNPKNDRCIFLGDLVDRGPDSAGCVQYVRKMGFECIRGNHEDKYIRYRAHARRAAEDPKYKNPMRFNQEKKDVWNNLTSEDLDWLEDLPKFITVPEHNIIAVHAGLQPHRHPEHQHPKNYMFLRFLNDETHKMVSLNRDFSQPENSTFWADLYDQDMNVIYGHIVHNLETPVIHTALTGAKTYGIDTGCVFGGHLTAAIFTAGHQEPQFVSVKPKETRFPGYVTTKMVK